MLFIFCYIIEQNVSEDYWSTFQINQFTTIFYTAVKTALIIKK